MGLGARDWGQSAKMILPSSMLAMMASGEMPMALSGNAIPVRVGLSNPYHPEHQHRQGNRMALANIRERLQLHFDVEGRLDTAIDGDRYRIDMVMPYRRAG